jgi:hypothetical protein
MKEVIMARYTLTHKVKPEDIVDAAKNYFGREGLGLKIIDEGVCCIRFEGGGGFVNIFTEPSEGQTRVNLEVREWDNDTKDFLRKIHKMRA